MISATVKAARDFAARLERRGGGFAAAAFIFTLAAAVPALADTSAWETAPGESLRSLSRALFPESPSVQERFIARIRASNPEITVADDVPLATGSQLRVPDLRSLGVVAMVRPEATADRTERSEPRALPATVVAAPQAHSSTPVERLDQSARPVLRASTVLASSQRSFSDEQRQLLRLQARIFNGLASQGDIVGALLLLEDTQQQLQQQLSTAELRKVTASAPSLAESTTIAEHRGKSVALVDLLWPIGGALLALTASLTCYRRPRRYVSAQALAAPEPVKPASLLAPAADSGLPVLGVDTAGPESLPPAGETEGSGVLELADMMLGFGRIKGAAAVLHAYISNNPDEALRPWVKLLDVYRQAAMREQFDEVASRLHAHFNVQLPEWNQGNSLSFTARSIESFPHIIEALIANWGSVRARDFIKHLLRDNRGGERAGFTPEVVEELIFLQVLLEERLRAETQPVSEQDNTQPQPSV